MSTLPAILAAGEPPLPSAPSGHMPNVRVEIAWNAGWSTPAASRTWTDVSDFVELEDLITITWGRGDERSTADANTLTLTLDNSDGRFTFGKSSSPYFPNVELGRPIRVVADPVDGWESTRFLGFIDQLPTEWESTDGYAKTTITATSRLARLGGQATLTNIVTQTILADSPLAYYTLGEPEGATQANDSSGNGADPLVVVGDPALPMVFGTATGPGTDGLTAATFAGGVGDAERLEAAGALTPNSSTFSLLVAFVVDPSGGGSMISMHRSGTSQGPALTIGVVISGLDGNGTLVVDSPSSYKDGLLHVAELVGDGTSFSLYIDGVLIDSGTGTALTSGTAHNLNVGRSFTGTLAHATFFSSANSGSAAAAHSAAMLTGYAGDLTSARLLRYAAMAGIASTEISAETGQTAMVHADTTDQTPIDMMRLVEATEGGVLYDERDGMLTFHNRAHRYTAASAYTLTISGDQEVEAGYAPKVDRTGLLNDVTVQNADGTVTAHKVDTASRDKNGRATGGGTTYSTDVNQPNDLASWLLYTNKDPKERAPQLAVNALAQVGKTPNCATVMATTVGTTITVAGRPSQAATSTIDYFVEGGSEVYGPESLMLTFNVSPSAPYDQVLIIDDPVRGAIDTYAIGF